MMKKIIRIVAVGCLSVSMACCVKVNNPQITGELPPVFPDYCGVTVPVNIAPLNFGFADFEGNMHVSIQGNKGEALTATGSQSVRFNPAQWKNLLRENSGDSLLVTVSARAKNEQWVQYKPFTIYVSSIPVNEYLAYRLIAPGYEVYSKMGIYQRNLTSFREEAILENTLIPSNCMNCHSFSRNDPEKMSLHIRGPLGGTIMKDGDSVQIFNTKTDSTLGNCVYPYWHPGGRYITYSVNTTLQVFHAIQNERVEVVDLASDIVVLDTRTNRLLSCDLLKTNDFETFPSFSPDGKTLYFSSSAFKSIPQEYKEVRYNLCAIAFDPDSGTFGDKVDTLVNAAAIGKSISYGRPSPDGKYIMFTLSDYGNFSIWHKEANLWLLNLEDGSMKELTNVNSPDVESYHSWSSEGFWFVFSSRRLDGLYTRLFLAGISRDGTVSKPFLLPQKDPFECYDASFFSYNVPEFLTGPVKWDVRRMYRALNKPERKTLEYIGDQNLIQ
jgi:hypothetical protein